MRPVMDVELVPAPQCPSAAVARTVLTSCLRRLDLPTAAVSWCRCARLKRHQPGVALSW